MTREDELRHLRSMAECHRANTGRLPSTVKELADHWFEIGYSIVEHEHIDEDGFYHPGRTVWEYDLHHPGECMWLEEIEQAIEAIETMLAAQADEAAKVIEGTAEPAALPAPEASIGAGLEPKSRRRPNRLMMQADTAVGPRERTPRQRKVPSPPAA